MASSRAGRWRWLPYVVVLSLGFVVGFGLGMFLPRPEPAGGLTPLPPNVVKYRYQWGGEVVTHYLPNVVSVSLYGPVDAVDQVVFNLMSGRDYVLNADVLVDYVLPSDGSITTREMSVPLYHHYDPYLQGEKQEWHREWVDEQFIALVGRLPTDDEWLMILNELTRGVEHHQMERWIQYSPAAIERSITERYETLLGREPRPAELTHYTRALLAGLAYDDVELEIAGEGTTKRQ